MKAFQDILEGKIQYATVQGKLLYVQQKVELAQTGSPLFQVVLASGVGASMWRLRSKQSQGAVKAQSCCTPGRERRGPDLGQEGALRGLQEADPRERGCGHQQRWGHSF